jgi:hypothetical protein
VRQFRQKKKIITFQFSKHRVVLTSQGTRSPFRRRTRLGQSPALKPLDFEGQPEVPAQNRLLKAQGPLGLSPSPCE